MIRQFAGPTSNELAILCRPDSGTPGTADQAEATYQALARLLAAQGASFRHLTGERLFLRDIQRDLPMVLDVRKRVLTDIGQAGWAPSPVIILQPPVDRGASFELLASAVVPHDRGTWSLRDVRLEPLCPCDGCAQSGARLVGLCDQTTLHATNVYGIGGDATKQASSMFRTAERLLNQCGMSFHNVVRTWIHLRDIDRDYDALNEARRTFFRDCGIEIRPASIGVQGIPFPDAHDFSISLHAVKSARPLDATPMSTPALNEAWEYGSEFSRGLRITEANKTALYLSGTASIDEAGRTAHPGDFEAQVDRMLHNIESLLAQQGATQENLVSGVTYLKDAGDAPVLRAMFKERGFADFPCVLVEAGLCRPDLLCETEALAMLSLKTRRA